jgi:hypothetical protein
MTVKCRHKMGAVASVFVRSAAKRSLIVAASPVRKNAAPAAGRSGSAKALTTIGYSRKNRRNNDKKLGIIQIRSLSKSGVQGSLPQRLLPIPGFCREPYKSVPYGDW